jgi:hypothetical protein
MIERGSTLEGVVFSGDERFAGCSSSSVPRESARANRVGPERRFSFIASKMCWRIAGLHRSNVA